MNQNKEHGSYLYKYITMSRYTSPIWTEPTEQFQKRVNSCTSIADIVRSFDFAVGAAIYKMIYARVARDGIDISHIPKGVDANKGRIFDTRRVSLDVYLIDGSSIKSSDLKRRLIRDGTMVDVCVKCGLGNEWFGSPISLQLDHINGKRDDNRLENLRILCPNCHSQTPTFCGRHKRNVLSCTDCKKKISDKRNKRCQSCAAKERARIDIVKGTTQTLKFDISKEELEKLVWEKPTERIGRDFGVSGKAVEKRCKKFGIEKPPRGYWMRNRTPAVKG